MDKFISRIVVMVYLTMAVVPIGYMPAALADGNGFLALCPTGNTQNLHFSKRSSLYETMVKQGAPHQASTLDAGLDHSSHDSSHDSSHNSLGYTSGHSSHYAEQSNSTLQHHGVHKTHSSTLTNHTSANIHDSHAEDNNKCNYATVSSAQDFLKFPSLIPLTLDNTRLSATTQRALVIIAVRLRKQQSRAPPIVTIFS